MPTVISGILKDGMGKPIPNCTIELKALRTSTTVITKTIASQQPEKNGSYSMNVELGKYGVTLCVEGFPPNYVGEIYVHSGSVPGTLNYYLGLPTEGDLPPAAIQQFEAMVELVSQQSAQVGKDKAAAAKSAADALASQTAAKLSETSADSSAKSSKLSETNAGKSQKDTEQSAKQALASQEAAKLSETAASSSQTSAAKSASEALASQTAAKTSETNAKQSADAADASAKDAKLSETNAKTSETNAGKSAGAALASEKAAKTSETNTAKGIEAAAASAQAAKLSENNADVSKKAAQTSAAEALASQGAAKTSETNAGNSAKAASGSADKAKTEADRATAATDGKQDENALLTAIAALNTAADQIITLTGKNSVETAVLTKFAKEMLAKTDADGVREYLGLKETVNKAASALQNGSWGLGNVNYGVLPMGVTSQFLIYSSSAPEVPANCAGFQAAYGKTRRAQIVINTMGEVFSRFSMSDEVLDKTTPWAKHFTTLKPPTANEVNAWPIEIRGMIGNGTLFSSANQTGVYLVSVADPTTVADFPKNNNVPLYGYGFVIVTKNGATLNQLYMSHRGHMANRQSWNNEAGYNAWDIVYGTVNTTVDSNGFIKRASPIVKLFSDGSSELNSESEGVTVSRESVGVYRISGVLGMNSDGAWGGIDGGFEVPTDRNGQRLLWLDYEVEADGSIFIKTYHRTYPEAPVFARNTKDGYEEGDLIDIPSDQFLSVRVEMPQDSIYNLRIEEDEEQRKIIDEMENNER